MGGEEAQIWGRVEIKFQNSSFLGYFAEDFTQEGGHLGQKYLLGKHWDNCPRVPWKMTIFPGLALLSTCPSQNSGISTYKKIIFLK